MKKLIAWSMALLCLLSLAGCDNPDLGEADTDVSENDRDSYTVTARYDYGMHRTDLATILYDFSTAFFELPEGIDVAIAGDVFTVEHSGRLMIQETYPSTVVFDDGKVESVKLQKAIVVQLTYDPETECFSLMGEESGETVTVATHPLYYLTDAEGHFAALDEVTEPLELYASYSPVDGYQEEKGYTLAGMYTFNPRNGE